jgi:hypothetical protein
MANNLDNEFKYFLDHQEELVKQYREKFLVIKDSQVKGAFNTEGEAYAFGSKNYELGTFLIQQCLPGENAYTQTYHSRVIF